VLRVESNGVNNVDEDEKLLTVREVAVILRVCEATVRRRVEDGELAATRVGRLIRVSRAALREYLEENGVPV